MNDRDFPTEFYLTDEGCWYGLDEVPVEHSDGMFHVILKSNYDTLAAELSAANKTIDKLMAKTDLYELAESTNILLKQGHTINSLNAALSESLSLIQGVCPGWGKLKEFGGLLK